MPTDAKPDLDETDDAEHFCPVCFAKHCALEVIDAGVTNALAAGCDPDEIMNRVIEALDQMMGEDDDEADRITADTQTAGRA